MGFTIFILLVLVTYIVITFTLSKCENCGKKAYTKTYYFVNDGTDRRTFSIKLCHECFQILEESKNTGQENDHNSYARPSLEDCTGSFVPGFGIHRNPIQFNDIDSDTDNTSHK